MVLDGTPTRLEQAELYQRQLLHGPERLLIRCPRAASPPQPMPELLQGYDTATQITALADWLQHRQAPAPQRIWIATDPDHTARATLLARIALAGRGIEIQPDPPPPPSPSERRKFLRDALRLSLWRATGSTGAELVPQIVARKRADCGVWGGVGLVKAPQELFRLQVVRALLVGVFSAAGGPVFCPGRIRCRLRGRPPSPLRSTGVL